jgi:hypothetical protein
MGVFTCLAYPDDVGPSAQTPFEGQPPPLLPDYVRMSHRLLA